MVTPFLKKAFTIAIWHFFTKYNKIPFQKIVSFCGKFSAQKNNANS
jgi:hypothetical protein